MDKRSLFFIVAVSASLFLVNIYFSYQRDDENRLRIQQQESLALEKQAAALEEKVPAVVENKNFECADSVTTDQRYYVLENAYMQVVFSNYGGAIAEINLPFRAESSPKSVVLPVEIDHVMEEKHPYNDHYPAHPYYIYGKDGEQENESIGGYYPLLRRGLIDPGSKEWKIAPKYYALNVVSQYPEVANLVYTVKEFSAYHIVLEATQSLRRITKTFRLPEDSDKLPYMLECSLQIEGDSRGLWLTSGVPAVDLMSGGNQPVLKYRFLREGKAEVKVVDLPKDILRFSSEQPMWLSNSNGFFGVILDPMLAKGSPGGFQALRIPGGEVPTRLALIDAEYQLHKVADYPGYQVLVPIQERAAIQNFRMFCGPYDDVILKLIDANLYTAQTPYNPSYVDCQNFQGWFSFISEPFAKFLFILMKFFHSWTGSWALSIFLLTVVLRLLLYPLNSWSMKSMRRMQQLSPQIQEVQKKYKKDPKKAQMEVMAIYRMYGVNPLGGCFPLLIQMPFLIGMFDLLRSSFQLRGATFIPGWIENLAAPDILFSWDYPIPFVGSSFHLLPFLLGAVMFLQQRMTSTLPEDKALWTDQQRQQRFMGNIMTLVFTVMFYNFPSGLNIYWLSSMVLGIFQQWIVNRKMGNIELKPKVLVDNVPIRGKHNKRARI